MNLSKEAMSKFSSVCYEVDLLLKVNTETGKAKILQVNGHDLVVPANA